MKTAKRFSFLFIVLASVGAPLFAQTKQELRGVKITNVDLSKTIYLKQNNPG